MKKKFVLFLTLTILTLLTACGKSSSEKIAERVLDELNKQGLTDNNDSSNSSLSGIGFGGNSKGEFGSINSSDDSENDDLSADLSVFEDSNIIYSELSNAEKQAIIAEGEASGVDVVFNSDGSTSFFSEGMETRQNADGTWVWKDENNDNVYLGSSWPDNEYSRLIPKPDFEVTNAYTLEDTFLVAFSGESLEDVKDYVEKLKKAGFNLDGYTDEYIINGEIVYSFAAQNKDGYSVEVSSAYGVISLTIYKY